MIDVVVGGQFGSEAKGHVAGILAMDANDIFVRIGGPNAGHSVVDHTGRKWAFRHVPVSAPLHQGLLVIAQGSEVDYKVLKDELAALDEAGHQATERMLVDRQATYLDPRYITGENDLNMMARIGSTSKGIGIARAERIMRTAETVRDVPIPGISTIDSAGFLRSSNAANRHIVIEGTQGYGLGLHAGYYPFCTSGNCRSIDFLAQAGLSAAVEHRTWVVFRTHPIRVAGNSGPMYDETTWELLGDMSNGYIQPEQTTVTKKTRRVGFWDPQLALSAWRAHEPNRNNRAVLTFVDYLDPALADCTDLDKLQASPAWGIIEGWERYMNENTHLARPYKRPFQFDLFTTSASTHIWRNRP